jgi:hypothetical protein
MDTKIVWGKTRKNLYQKDEELSSVNGSLKSKEAEFSETKVLNADTVRFRVSISTKVSPM